MTDLTDPLVTTDQTDYAPGSTATFTASGFGIGDNLEFTITVIDPTTGATLWSGPSWAVIDGSAGDLAVATGGTVQTQFYVSDAYLDATIQLTVDDLTDPSKSATVVFTDATPTDFAYTSTHL